MDNYTYFVHEMSSTEDKTAMLATLDKGKHKNNNKMDCQPYRKRRPATQKGGVFAWQGKEKNVPRDGAEIRFLFRLHLKK